MQDVALGAGRERVERPAGREHEFGSPCRRIDAGGIEANHSGGIRAKTKVLAITACDIDQVTNGDIPKEAEMSVAVRCIYGNTPLARVSRLADMAGTKSERLAARAFQHDRAGADPPHLDPRDRPGIGPGPWPDHFAGRNAPVERALQQHLREPRFSVDVGAVTEQDDADQGESQGRDEAGHCFHTRHCERSEATQNLSAEAAWIASLRSQ